MAERGPGGKFVREADAAAASDLAGAGADETVAVRAALTANAVNAGPAASTDVEVAHAVMPEAGTAEYAQAIEELRQRRRVFGQSTQKLALPERRGYHRHWFNDTPGRVEEALNNGWSHVQDRDRKPVCRVVGTGRDSQALRAYAMELPLPIWEEDQAANARRAQDRIDDIKGAGAFSAKAGQAKPSDEGKFYSPRETPVRVGESLVKT